MKEQVSRNTLQYTKDI